MLEFKQFPDQESKQQLVNKFNELYRLELSPPDSLTFIQRGYLLRWGGGFKRSTTR